MKCSHCNEAGSMVTYEGLGSYWECMDCLTLTHNPHDEFAGGRDR